MPNISLKLIRIQIIFFSYFRCNQNAHTLKNPKHKSRIKVDLIYLCLWQVSFWHTVILQSQDNKEERWVTSAALTQRALAHSEAAEWRENNSSCTKTTRRLQQESDGDNGPMERRHQSDVRPTCSADLTNSKPFILRADGFKLISVYSSLLFYSVAFQL